MRLKTVTIPVVDIIEIVEHYHETKNIKGLEAITRILIDTPIGETIGEMWLEDREGNYERINY